MTDEHCTPRQQANADQVHAQARHKFHAITDSLTSADRPEAELVAAITEGLTDQACECFHPECVRERFDIANGIIAYAAVMFARAKVKWRDMGSPSVDAMRQASRDATAAKLDGYTATEGGTY